jgi:hypothetical protein
MKQQELAIDDMRDEYDFSQSVRGPYAELAGEVHLVSLDPDVAVKFPDSESVNTALRTLMDESAELSQAG